jgi:uridine phosphorylase
MQNFPNFKNKHNHDSLFSPDDFLNYLKSVNKGNIPQVPENVVFVYQSSLLEHIESRSDFEASGELGQMLGGKFYVSKNGKLGVIAKFGIGSPIAVTILEELIAMGSKRFFNIGTSGSLQKESQLGDIVLCDKAIRDEGTSHHYLKSSKYAHPSKKLLDNFEGVIKQTGTPYVKGGSWTIDAPYRETIEEAKQYQKEGIYTVEMEAAALFAVAEYRDVEIISAFSISDLLGELEWKPAFHSSKTADSLIKIFELIVDFSK